MAGTVAPLLAAILLLASLVISVGVTVRHVLVPHGWRVMAVLSPLFVAGGVGTASLHMMAFDPLLDLAAVELGEVLAVGKGVSRLVPTEVGYRADVRVEHLWYEEKEVLRGGGV